MYSLQSFIGVAAFFHENFTRSRLVQKPFFMETKLSVHSAKWLVTGPYTAECRSAPYPVLMGDRFQYYYLNCAYVAQDYYAFPHASYMA